MSTDSTNPEPGLEGFWLTEQLTGGHQRHWSDHARAWSADFQNRQRLAEAIGAMRWYRPTGELPYSPGLLLREMLRAMPQVPLAVGISDHAPEFPELHLLDRDPEELCGDLLAAYPVVAVRLLVGCTIVSTYYLDCGLEARPFATDQQTRPDRPGPESAMCAAELHVLCKRRVTVPGGPAVACRCECGHRSDQQGPPAPATAADTRLRRGVRSQRSAEDDTAPSRVPIDLDHGLHAELQEFMQPGEDLRAAIARLLTSSRGDGPKARSATAGPLKPLVDTGVFEPGDELRWERPRRSESHIATVDDQGRLVAPDGSAHHSIAALSRACAGPNAVAGWSDWVHLRSGSSLATWRDQTPIGGWSDEVAEVLIRLPRGAWTTIADLASLVERSERAVGAFLHHSRTEGHHRVLTEDGQPRRGTAFAGMGAEQRREQLLADGIGLNDIGAADPAGRLGADQLAELGADRSDIEWGRSR